MQFRLSMVLMTLPFKLTAQKKRVKKKQHMFHLLLQLRGGVHYTAFFGR
jgi:hypothetical protein